MKRANGKPRRDRRPVLEVVTCEFPRCGAVCSAWCVESEGES